MIIETLEEIRYEITGNQKLQEKQTTVNDSHRSIVKKPIQDKIRRLWCLRRKTEEKEYIKNKNIMASLQPQIFFMEKKACINFFPTKQKKGN